MLLPGPDNGSGRFVDNNLNNKNRPVSTAMRTSRQVAATDGERGTGDETRFGAGNIGNHAGDLVVASQPFQRHRRLDRFHPMVPLDKVPALFTSTSRRPKAAPMPCEPPNTKAALPDEFTVMSSFRAPTGASNFL
jgi:hypothetical protein